VPRHVARLNIDYFALRRLVNDYFAYAACLGASARRAARRRLLRLAQAHRRPLRLHRASGCLGTSCGSSSGSSSTTSP
jgi:xanthine/CO dehydrogenase XdhC/CoxF family maturation factor